MRAGRYEYFDRIEKIQDILKQQHIISLELHHSQNISAVQKEITDSNCNRYILIQLRTSFMQETYHKASWRDDHFALILPDINGYRLLNDIPASETTLHECDLQKAYAGNYFVLSILKKSTEIDTGLLWTNRRFKPENYKPFMYQGDDLDDIMNLEIRLRNLTGIYKISRYRLQRYYAGRVDMSYTEPILRKVEQLYGQFEYFHLRKNVPPEKIFDAMQKLCDLDYEFMMPLKEKLECENNAGSKKESQSNSCRLVRFPKKTG